MKTLDIYLDFCFLQFFLESEPEDRYSDEYQNWFDFLKFLQNHEHIRIITPNRLKEFTKDFFVKELSQLLRNKDYRHEFFENFPKGTEKYKVAPHFAYETEIKNPHSVFFIDFSELECQILEKKYGFFFINSDNFKTKWRLLNPRNYQSFKRVSAKGDFKSWNDFAQLKHPANTVLITDRYIFGGNYQHNIQEMFDNLFENITEKCQILLIIGNAVNNRETDFNREKELKKYWNTATKKKWSNSESSVAQIFLRENNRRIDINLTHDRRIISNYFYLVSGDSYTYLNKNQEVLADTDFHIYTVFSSDVFAKMQDLLFEFQKLLFREDTACKIHISNRVGDCKSKFFSQF